MCNLDLQPSDASGEPALTPSVSKANSASLARVESRRRHASRHLTQAPRQMRQGASQPPHSWACEMARELLVMSYLMIRYQQRCLRFTPGRTALSASFCNAPTLGLLLFDAVHDSRSPYDPFAPDQRFRCDPFKVVLPGRRSTLRSQEIVTVERWNTELFFPTGGRS
jgi:hypothetical protein